MGIILNMILMVFKPAGVLKKVLIYNDITGRHHKLDKHK